MTYMHARARTHTHTHTHAHTDRQDKIDMSKNCLIGKNYVSGDNIIVAE